MIRRAIWVVLFLPLTLFGQVEFCDEPVFMNPRPTGLNLYDTLYEDGVSYIIGQKGLLMSTTNLQDYQIHERFTHANLRTLFHFKERYVISAEGGNVFIAEQMSGPWTPVPNLENRAYLAAAQNQERAVIMGTGGAVLTSEDGVTWTQRESGTTRNINFVTWVNQRFMACGDLGLLLESLDGIQWQTLPAPEISMTQLAWNGSRWVVGTYDGLYTSEDAVQWTKVEGLVSGSDAVYWTGTHFLVLASNLRCFISEDGLAWERITIDVLGASFEHVQWHGDRLLAVGFAGSIFSSTDGHEWTPRYNLPWSNLIVKLLHTGERFVGIDSGDRVFLSEDGENWRIVRAPHTNAINPDLAFNGNELFLTGDYEHLYKSTNGEDWTPVYIGPGFFSGKIIWNGSQWLTLGIGLEDTAVAISTDGESWEILPAPSQIWFGWNLVWTGDRYVTVYHKNIYSSTDGREWEIYDTGLPGTLNDTATSGSRTVVVGGADIFLYSDDGEQWLQGGLPEGDRAGSVESVSWNGYFFLATGLGDPVFVSYDGIHWIRGSWPIFGNFLSHLWLDGVFYGAGTGSRIIKMECPPCINEPDFKSMISQWPASQELPALIRAAATRCGS